jgi:AcrR family transcriptional regulator
MEKTALKPRKKPLQKRSTAMIEIILQAAARVLERESLTGFNTNRIAEVAGISIGSLYQYFPNKDALVAALIIKNQQLLSLSLEKLIEDVHGKSLHDAITTLAELAVRQQFGKPLLAAALDHEERRLPLTKILQQADMDLLKPIQTLLDRHSEELATGIGPNAAQDCLTITKALTDKAAMSDKEAPPAFAERIARAILGYLTFSASKKPTKAPVSPRVKVYANLVGK